MRVKIFCLLLQVTLSLRRDGTDGQAVVFWSLRPIGDNQADVTPDDLKPLSGSVVFLTGQSDAVINVTIMADNIPEVNETLLLTLDRYCTATLRSFGWPTYFHSVNQWQCDFISACV